MRISDWSSDVCSSDLDADFAAVRLFRPGDKLEQRGLARAVRPDHADDAARRKAEAQVLEQQLVAIGLAEVLRLDHRPAKPLGHLDEDLCAAGATVVLPVRSAGRRGGKEGGGTC